MNRKKIMLITSEGQTIKEKKYSSLPWYLARGIGSEDVLAAYQAKGAGSYANSLENLVEDTYTLIDTGHAPDWDDVNGWKFDGIIQGLLTPSLNDINDEWSGIVRFSNLTIPGMIGYPYFSHSESDKNFLITVELGGYNTAGINGASAPDYTAFTPLYGVVATTKDGIYLDGIIKSSDWSPSPPSSFTTNGSIGIGCDNNYSTYFIGYIQAIAFYAKALTPAQIAAVSAAMAAL